MRRCLVRSVLSLCYTAIAFTTGTVRMEAQAHPVPAAQAKLALSEAGTYELRIKCDVAALVMQTMPGHLGKAAEELRLLSREELQARVDDAAHSTEYYLQLQFDGARSIPHTTQFPDLELLLAAAAHGEGEAWPEVILQGDWPATAKSCEILFPAAIGRVQFELVQSGQRLFSDELASGKSSGELSLQNSPTKPHVVLLADRISWILVALLLAYLCRLYLRRPRNYSRNTKTGQ